MIRLLLLLLGTLGAERPGQRAAAWYRADDPDGGPDRGTGYPGPDGSVGTDGWPGGPEALPPWREAPAGAIGRPGGGSGGRGRGRRRIPLGLKWAAALLVIGLIFRRAIASVVLMALSAAFHLVGVNAHLPSVSFAWPWQTIAAGTTTNTDLGPWVLQKIQGISSAWARPLSTFCSPTGCPRTSARGRAGTPVRSTPWPMRRPPLTSIPARPGGHRARVITSSRSSAVRRAANLVT